MSALEQSTEPRMHVIPLPELHSAAWHEMRAGYIGASDVATLFGASRHKTMEMLVAEKTTGEMQEETPAMALGTFVEPMIADKFEEIRGVRLLPPEVAYGRGRLLSNPDRLVLGSDSDLVEVKFSFSSIPRLPRAFYWQAMAQLACTGMERVHFAILDADGFKFDWVVHRDDSVISEIDAAVETWWAFVDDELDPPIFGREPHKDTVHLAARDAELVRNYRLVKEQADELNAEKDALRAQIESVLGVSGLEQGSRLDVRDSDGKPLVNVRIQKGRAGLDTKHLALDHPEICAAYEIQGESFPVVTIPKEAR